MNIFLICSVLVTLLPAVYLAKQKNLLFIDNSKNNIFLTRFIFLLPGTLSVELIFFLISIILFIFIPFELSSFLYWISVLLMSLLVSSLTILIFKKYVLRSDLPFEERPDFDKYDLYVFMPDEREIEDSSSYKLTGKIGSARIGIQVKELSLNFSKIKGDILFTEHGEFIVSTRVLNMLQDKNLTGYKTKSVVDLKTKQESDSYFQLVADELEPLSSQTVFKKGFFGSILIDENKLYYSNSILETAADFNRTVEYIGDNTGFPYYHQRFWVITNKTMKMFLSNFGKSEKDFIPIQLINDVNSESIMES
jgi:hypothetical protein